MISASPRADDSASDCSGICALQRVLPRGKDVTVPWKSLAVRERVRVFRSARRRLAANQEAFLAAISPNLPRSKADTLLAEVLPLLDACKFLERNAERILAPRKLGRSGRPLWLSGVQSEIYREPLGLVLVIGPANFPLFLAGAQVFQALVAGNTVTWKPGNGGAAVAHLVADTLREAGLPDGALRITNESVEAGQEALAAKPDKVIFTGSANSGKAVLKTLAEAGTPAVAELSGADAVIVMPGADLDLTAKAIAFGLRLNGAQVCMSPRRVFAKHATMEALKPKLLQELKKLPPVRIAAETTTHLEELCAQARALGADINGQVDGRAQTPLVVDKATVEMRITAADIFAPVVSLLSLPSLLELPEAYNACPYALAATIFCSRDEEPQARGFAKILRAGTILINDLIAPTADPRVPFGGRGMSGYGTTRGAEGLLEMTAVKTVLIRRGGLMSYLHLQPTRDDDAPLIAGLVRVLHGGSWRERWRGIRALVQAPRMKSRREL